MFQTRDIAEPTRIEISLEHLVCGGCGCVFAMPAVVLRAKREHHETWFCPNGHPCSDEGGETVDVQAEVTRLRAMTMQHKGVGTCPYCQKKFKRLDRHLTWKHQKEQLENS